MVATNPHDALYSHLYRMRRMGAQTTSEIWGELCGLRAGGVAEPSLPKSHGDLEAALKSLAIQGRAENRGDGWVWCEPRNVQQERLFA